MSSVSSIAATATSASTAPHSTIATVSRLYSAGRIRIKKPPIFAVLTRTTPAIAACATISALATVLPILATQDDSCVPIDAERPHSQLRSMLAVSSFTAWFAITSL